VLSRFIKGLSKTRDNILGKFGGLLGKKIDDDLLESLEESLIAADVGPGPASQIVAAIRKNADGDLTEILRMEIFNRVNIPRPSLENSQTRPHVIMFVGVNGSGKTTSIGKLSYNLTAKGKRVVLAAADTFRAAAAEQLTLWAEKSGAQIIKAQEGADPGAVTFDAIKAGMARQADFVMIDTAGRLQTRVNLMEELKKIKRVADKAMPGAPHDIWLVLDASIGQNSFSQVELFNQAVGLTGLVLAKLDGTSKGGAIVAISDKYKLPVQFVGLGEQPEDLEKFDPAQFAQALVSQ
jgi:fused signal recognition particle receptor